MAKLFLLKINDYKGQNCVWYIDSNIINPNSKKLVKRITVEGATFESETLLNSVNYDDVTTILTKEELQQLVDFNESVKLLNYGLSTEEYKQIISLSKELKPIYDKLNSKENDELFEKIIEEEMRYIANAWFFETDFDEPIAEPVIEMFENYPFPYRDRSIISTLYEDVETLGKEEAYRLGLTENPIVAKYFRFRDFGLDLLSEDAYLKLSNGEIVKYNLK